MIARQKNAGAGWLNPTKPKPTNPPKPTRRRGLIGPVLLLLEIIPLYNTSRGGNAHERGRQSTGTKMTVGVEPRLSLPRGPSVAGGDGRSGRLQEYVYEGPPKQGPDKRGRPFLHRPASQVSSKAHALYGKGPVTTISSLLIDYPVSCKQQDVGPSCLWDHESMAHSAYSHQDPHIDEGGFPSLDTGK